MTSPRLTFYASTIRTRQQAESAREDRAYWAAQDRLAAQAKAEADKQDAGDMK